MAQQQQTQLLPMLLLLLLLSCMAVQQCSAQYQQGQATWYDSIYQGFCGYFSDIPSNGYVAAWPYIETGPPGTGQGFWQPGVDGDACGQCLEVSCVPGYVESADGSIYLDRNDACRDPNLGIIVKVVDECRCSNADRQLNQRGNFNWCCNVATPRLGVDRHIDLSKQAFTELVRGGEFGLGILSIKWRRASCNYIGLVTINADGSTTPRQGGGSGGSGPSSPAPAAPHQASPHLQPSNPPPPPSSNPPSNNPPPSTSNPPSTPPPPSKGSPSKTSSSNSNKVLKKLPAQSQCGGTSGDCEKFGGPDACIDDLFPGYTCDTGLMCVRQNRYYYQCWQPQQIPSLGSGWTVTKPSRPSGPGPEGSPDSQAAVKCEKVLGLNQQCGGMGSGCKGSECVDAQVGGVCCEQGLKCKRFDQWYWECRQ